MTRILRHVPDMDSVYFRDLADQKPEELTIGYVVITSDKGMAGAYNQNILKIANEDDFTYFTVLNKGNYGYNGTKKLIKKISKMNDYYCMIFMDDYYIVKKNKSFNYDKSQFDYEVVDYIMAQGEKVEESNGYFIYYIN